MTEWYRVKGFEGRYVMSADASRVISLGALQMFGPSLRIRSPVDLKLRRNVFALCSNGLVKRVSRKRLLTMKGEKLTTLCFMENGFLNDLTGF